MQKTASTQFCYWASVQYSIMAWFQLKIVFLVFTTLVALGNGQGVFEVGIFKYGIGESIERIPQQGTYV